MAEALNECSIDICVNRDSRFTRSHTLGLYMIGEDRESVFVCVARQLLLARAASGVWGDFVLHCEDRVQDEIEKQKGKTGGEEEGVMGGLGSGSGGGDIGGIGSGGNQIADSSIGLLSVDGPKSGGDRMDEGRERKGLCVGDETESDRESDREEVMRVGMLDHRASVRD